MVEEMDGVCCEDCGCCAVCDEVYNLMCAKCATKKCDETDDHHMQIVKCLRLKGIFLS